MTSPDFSDFDQKLKQVNLRLKGANIGVTLERKGGSLYARATLPPAPDSPKTSPHQQHLRLALRANLAALKQAEAMAKKIGAALDLKEFTWADYARAKNKPANQTVADWCMSFEVDYFEEKERNATTEHSFKAGYGTYLKRLPQNQALTKASLERTIKTTKPNSYSRSRICSAFKRFGKFAGIDISFINKDLAGDYSPFKPAPRVLPSDELLVECLHKISNPKWRWVYALLATYGLRPHEIFHVDTQELEQGGYTLKVLENTKTGYREVQPLYPEWVDQFGLRQKQLPNCTGKTNRLLGKSVSEAFRRYKIPFPPYNLRHRYAVRCIEFDINVALAARWMGHSVLVHTKTYQLGLSRVVEQRAFERALSNPNRPHPPAVQMVNQHADSQSEVA
jgi:integrase